MHWNKRVMAGLLLLKSWGGWETRVRHWSEERSVGASVLSDFGNLGNLSDLQHLCHHLTWWWLSNGSWWRGEPTAGVRPMRLSIQSWSLRARNTTMRDICKVWREGELAATEFTELITARRNKTWELSRRTRGTSMWRRWRGGGKEGSVHGGGRGGEESCAHNHVNL